MKANLKVLGGKNEGRLVPISREEFVIGRGSDCQLQPATESVSRRHCVLRNEKGILTVEDLGSRNGTLVNEKPISGRHELKSGDKMSVGKLSFEVLVDYETPGDKLSKVKDIKQAVARTAQRAVEKEIDVDIDSWLSDDEIEETSATRAFNLTDIKVVKSEADLEAERTAEENKNKKKGKKKGKGSGKKYGKLPTSEEENVAHKDTRDAATNMLHKFFSDDLKRQQKK